MTVVQIEGSPRSGGVATGAIRKTVRGGDMRAGLYGHVRG